MARPCDWAGMAEGAYRSIAIGGVAVATDDGVGRRAGNRVTGSEGGRGGRRRHPAGFHQDGAELDGCIPGEVRTVQQCGLASRCCSTVMTSGWTACAGRRSFNAGLPTRAGQRSPFAAVRISRRHLTARSRRAAETQPGSGSRRPFQVVAGPAGIPGGQGNLPGATLAPCAREHRGDVCPGRRAAMDTQ